MDFKLKIQFERESLIECNIFCFVTYNKIEPIRENMNIQLHHQFQTKSHDLVRLFEGIDKMSKFMRRLEDHSVIDTLRYEPNMYLGDGFEFFIELLLALHPVDNRLGVYNYTPVQSNDNGVDGIGVNILLEPCVIQVKYRSNTQSVLTATKDSLSNLFSDGMLAHNVVSDANNPRNYRHFVFTTADGLHFYTDAEMFKGKVKCVGYNDLRTLVDGNMPFWNKCREVVAEIVESQKN